MKLRMWTYDLAREQAPTLDHLRRLCDLSLESGYNALGLYLEHRFAYPSTPWMHGKGCLTPETVRVLQDEYPFLQIVPFMNLLGHFEGFIYTEEGRRFAESTFKGMQACPSMPEFQSLAAGLVDDVLSVFNSPIVHIGGDETWQLGACPTCKERVSEYEKRPGVDGKAQIYGEHFGPLARRVVEAGRGPAVWGDMFVDHPTALPMIPGDTLIFNWQYFQSSQVNSNVFRDAGFEVVYCPALHTYNATWLHLPQSERNVRENARDAVRDDAYGVCVTTWECGLFGNYETLFPAIRASGDILRSEEASAGAMGPVVDETIDYKDERHGDAFLKAYLREGENYEEWARLMGIELQNAGGPFTFGGIRSGLKCRLLLYNNPFLAWLHHHKDLCGEPGQKAWAICERASIFAPDASARGVTDFAKSAIEFVQHAERAHQAYARREPGAAVAALTPCRQILENLHKIALSNTLRVGGSLADQERCVIAKHHVERVMSRIKQYGDGSLGYLPSFETITHPNFVPHDQAAWWMINGWARE
ncbi:MAG: family 20 glycosylhydrolase [Fimbriimonas sp.]|nr:family 20 glycosylhydrolase [Fimbriimonas sp.]